MIEALNSNRDDDMTKTDFARQTAAAAAKELHRKGGALEGAALMERLFDEADLYDVWTIHVTREEMARLLSAEWRKVRGRSLGGYVAAVVRR